MSRKITAILAAILMAFGISLATAAPSSANVWCQGNPGAPSKSGNYIIGTGNMQCNNYSMLSGWRMQLVLQDAWGRNIDGTASGWINTPSWSYWGRTAMNSASYCLTSGSLVYRTEMQISATHKQYGYSGISYGYSSYVSRSCGISGYS